MSNFGFYKRFELSSISKYRTELMGIAILGVMWGHLMNKTVQPTFFLHFARLIHTYGFIFLSGFGLYYSFSKNSDITRFYKKRFLRLYLPYVIITFGFLLASVLFGNSNWLDFAAYLTTVAFWYEGNYYGMWYIAIAVFLYFIFPLLYYHMFGKGEGKAKAKAKAKPVYRLLIEVFVIFALLLTVQYSCPDYWENEKIGFCRILIFPLGVFCGYLAKRNYSISYRSLLFYFVFCFILMFVMDKIDNEYLGFGRTLLGIPLAVVSVDFMGTKLKKLLRPVMLFLGKYSLELYLLHLFISFIFKFFHIFNSAIGMTIGIIAALLLCKPVNQLVDKIVSKL